MYARKRLNAFQTNLGSAGSRRTSGNSRIKKPRHETVEKQKHQAIYKQFLQTTSIPGFSQLGRQKTVYGKFFWLFLFIAGFCLALYQSWGLVQDYYRYIIYQQSVLRMNATLPFPAITICNKNPIRWKHIGQRHPVRENISRDFIEMRGPDYISGYLDIYWRILHEGLLLQAMRDYNLEKPNDLEMYFPLTEVVAAMFWNSVDGKTGEELNNDFTTFHHPYYGSCFTFNAGIHRPPLYIEPSSDLAVGLFLDIDEDPEFLVRIPGFAILVHESGTSPILSSALVKQLYPGQWMKMTINMEKIERLPSPYPSKCVDKNDLNERRRMVYYSETQNTTYLYSIEGCRTTCMQNRTYAACGCIHAKIPYFPVKDIKLCVKEIDECSWDILALNLETCNCALPCNEFKYNVDVAFEGRDVMTSKYIQETVAFFLNDVLEKQNRTDVKWINSRVSVMQVIFESAQYENTVEQAKYSTADFYGAIGGNIGFWTGISILALMEVFELLFGCFIDVKWKKRNNNATHCVSNNNIGRRDILQKRLTYQNLNRSYHF